MIIQRTVRILNGADFTCIPLHIRNLPGFFPHSQPPKKAPPSGRPFQLAWQGQPTANAVNYDAPAAAPKRKRMAKTRLFAEFRGTPLAFGLSFSHPATNPAISRLPPAGGAEPERTGPRTTLNTPRDAVLNPGGCLPPKSETRNPKSWTN